MDQVRRFRSRLVFDDQGELWPADSFELRRRLYCVNYRGQLVNDVVRNIGFIAMDVGLDRVGLRLRRTTVSQTAGISLLYWLAENQPSRGYVFDLDSPTPRLLPSFLSLMAHIGAIANIEAPLDRVAERALGFEQLTPLSPLRELLRRWAQANGKPRFEDCEAIIKQHLGNRYVLARVTDGGRIIMEGVGSGLRIPNQSWFGRVIGTDLEHQPDRAYGRWVKKAYANVHRSQQPRVTDCDVDIYWPGDGWVRRKYRRLIIPCTAADGGNYLLSTNCTDAQTTLRALVV